MNLPPHLKSVSADYDDIARELKLADERANKASGDAAHFESLMREEHAKLVQLDQAKKALETEVGTFGNHLSIDKGEIGRKLRTHVKSDPELYAAKCKLVLGGLVPADPLC